VSEANGISPSTPQRHGSHLDPTRMFEGARLVVVGGTGFLGKVFWAMLLDRYPGVGHIFLVVRRKGASSPQERFASDIATSRCDAPTATASTPSCATR
jgi:hypothetical protein